MDFTQKTALKALAKTQSGLRRCVKLSALQRLEVGINDERGLCCSEAWLLREGERENGRKGDK